MVIDAKHPSRLIVCLLACLAASALHGRSPTAAGVMGRLTVTTAPPQATVYVDGVQRGISPCTIDDIGIGSVEVKVEKQGYETIAEVVVIAPDKAVELELGLVALPDVGAIFVSVVPTGARIELDRVAVGRTPKTLLNVPAGPRRIKVSAPGHRPGFWTVAVRPGQDHIISGRLALIKTASGRSAGVAMENLGKLDVRAIPTPAELPAERVLEPVRNLVRQRRYSEALILLDQIGADASKQQHAGRIGLQQTIVHRLQALVSLGYRQLANAKGQDFTIFRRDGIQTNGRLVDVSDTEAVIERPGGVTRVRLSQMEAEQVVRLSSRVLDPGQAASKIDFALLYAAEGRFERAYAELRQAGLDHDIGTALSYVDAERMWAAALHKQRQETMRRRAERHAPLQFPDEGASPVRILIDRHHGCAIPAQLVGQWEKKGFEVRELWGPFSAGNAAAADLLVVRDSGPVGIAHPYDRQEIQLLIDFVRLGGGLVFFGARRLNISDNVSAANPHTPLLRWFGIHARGDELTVTKKAPEDSPKRQAVCLPAAKHPLTYDVSRVLFPLASPSLAVENDSWVMLRGAGYVASKQRDEAVPPVVAARGLGKGRIAVFANVPLTTTSVDQDSPFYRNSAVQLVFNAVLWASEPARRRAAAGR